MIDEYVSPTVIDGCLSVSGLPNSRWLSLINLKLIKSRNRVLEIKAPEKAPFFLPTVAGLSGSVNFDRDGENDEEPGSKLVSNAKPLMALVSQFGKQMDLYCDDKEGKLILINTLKDMSPSKLDSGKIYGFYFHFVKYFFPEIGQLDPEGCCTSKPLLGCIRLLTDCLSDGIFWDACQAILKVVLQKHFEMIVEDENLMEAVEESQKATTSGRERVEKQIEESLLLSQFVINNTIAVQE